MSEGRDLVSMGSSDVVEKSLKRSFDETSPSNPETSSSASDHSDPFTPRAYQREVYEIAMMRNTIAVLETDDGNTFIAVMLIKKIGDAMKSSGKKKLIIFLAPSVNLVNQQFKVIKENTGFQVGEYYGAKGVDEWRATHWMKELSEHDVLVMTPQILLDTLRKASLSLEEVCLLIFDECHLARGNHPYTRIMKEFYNEVGSKPKIFGMTTSLMPRVASSAIKWKNQMAELEIVLDSQIYTIEDRAEMEIYVPYAKETCRLYDQFQCPHIDLMNKLLEAAFSKYDTSLSRIQDSDENHYKNIEDKIEIVGKQLSNDHANIMFCLNDLGLICTYEAVKDYLENTSSTHENENCRDIPLERKHYFEEVLNIIRDSLQMDNSISLELNPDYQEAVKLGQISPKLLELLLIFQSFGESDEVVCLILVERIITAKVIHQLVKKVPAFSHFTVSYLPGSSTSVDSLAPKMQKEFLKSFHSGKANLLFTTYEVEEGFVVPNCSYMIRFDLPKTICSYIQSRGWAQQDNSYYIMMVQRGNVKQRDQMFDLIRGEHSMTDTDINRDPYGYTSKADEENNVYAVEATGAPVTTNSTINLIYNFCQKLPFDKYFLRKPEFHFSYSGGECQCSLTIPPNTAFQKIVGPLSWNCHSAKQNVCLESCKKLHQMTSLNDHLVPSTKATPVEHLAPKRRESAASAGTTKRKELHGTASIHALSGTWGKGTDYATFQAYKLNFSCSNEDVNYSGFILLLESKLDEDVGNIEVDLYSLSKMVKSYVSSCGLVQMDPEQIVKAKRFHEFFFNGMFGKLFVGSKETRKCLFHNGTELLWSSSYAYLLLPIDTSEVHDDEPWKINWKAIDSCSSGIEFLKHCPLSLHINKETVNTPLHKRHPVDMIEPDAIKLHCANGSFDSNSLSEKVVVAVHTGRIYAVLQVAHEMTAETPFEESAGSKKDSFKSHADYFYQKYGLVLKYPQQQLLQLKQSHNPHNLLVDFRDLGAKISQGGAITKKPADHAFMPPELLYILDVPTTVLRSCYLLPSLLHRLESLMLASQLRGEISYQANDVNIPIYLILEAITTLRCNENFSMERLELLGDSVLKYTTSCHLFLKYPKMNEGQLTSLRSRVICNSNLHRLGTDHKIQGYIRDCPFDPRRWVAPGQLTRFPEPCGCNVDSSEVPLDPKFQSEDPKVKHGKLCDRGHRWLISKTISDCIEALIGAYYIAGGLVGTLHLMKWFGFEVELMSSSVIEAINSASLHSIVPKTANEIASLESKIGYQFSIKGILLEAMTHHSCQEEGIQYSYERLEFLGDSVLDMLITQYLYHAHPNTDPGELTDLRTASVNNESFAQSVVRYNLEVHMQHCSSLLPTQLKEYADMFHGADVNTRLHEGSKGPKPLGDFMESIAGAVLLDTNLNVDEVWKIFKPLLSPIVTPDKLELPPFRELTELCDHLGYFIKEKSVPKEEMMHAEISLQLKDELLMGQGQDHSRKEAKGKAALQVLKKLEARGITFARVMRKRKEDPDCADNATDSQSMAGISGERTAEHSSHKRIKIESRSREEGKDMIPVLAESSPKKPALDLPVPVVGPIDMKKGGPRTTIYQLCKQQQWPMPKFNTDEVQTSVLIDFEDGVKGFNSFTSKINLYIPNHGDIECWGNPRADKKSSLDSATLSVLRELQKQGMISCYDATDSQSVAGISNERTDEHSSPNKRKIESCSMDEAEDEQSLPKRIKIESCPKEEGKGVTPVLPEPSTMEPDLYPPVPVVGPIDMKKGGPRNAIYQLCMQQQWPVPTYETDEVKTSVLIDFEDGMKGFNSYTSKINLCIPNHGAIECRGNPRADKRSSLDSAALNVLHELQKQGRICSNELQGEDEHYLPKQRNSSSMEEGKDVTPVFTEPSSREPDLDPSVPVVGPIDMKKGGPRNALFELCKQQQWPIPTFQTDEDRSSVLLDFDDGVTGFNSFTSKINLCIPNHGGIECRGDPRADKKGSCDSAALSILHELQKQGRIIIRMLSSC